MYTLKIKNALGEVYELTHNLKKYIVLRVDGLTPPKINVNTVKGSIHDGTFFNSASANARNIVITIQLAGEIEKNRAEIYRIFLLKKPCEIYFKNVNRDVKITGYVEAIESDLFVAQEQMQISLICPRAYFEDVDETISDLSTIYDRFSFAFSIEVDEPIPIAKISTVPVADVINAGEVETGAVFVVTFRDACSWVRLHSVTTGEDYGVTLVFAAGDVLTINTNVGEKAVTLTRNSIDVNAINYLDDGSKWLQLQPGANVFSYTTSAGNDAAEIEIKSKNLYGGV